jgi:hypothetical protein
MTGPETDGGAPRIFRKVPESGPEREALRVEALAMLDAGKPQRLAAEALGISRGSLRRLVDAPGGSPCLNGHAPKSSTVEALRAADTDTPAPEAPSARNDPSTVEAPTSGTAAELAAYELRLAAEALAAGERDKALALLNRARFRGASPEQIAVVIDARPRPPEPEAPPARVKPERVIVELPGFGALDRRLVLGAGAVILGLVVLAAAALIWQARSESRPGAVELAPAVESESEAEDD